jgi:predicted metal-dependent hydrolase
MELDSHRRRWIMRKFSKYCKQIGLTRFQRPIIILDKEILNVPSHMTNWTRTKVRDIGASGATYGGASQNLFTFINVARHSTVEDLEDTIVHELVHIRFPKLQHGKGYQKRVDQILGGKEYEQLK